MKEFFIVKYIQGVVCNNDYRYPYNYPVVMRTLILVKSTIKKK